MAYQAFARKYRPQTWASVVGQDHVTRTLANAITLGRVHHAYLLCGARGIGKTTIARLLAKTLNCTQPDAKTMEPCNACHSCLEITEGRSLDVQEIDGASNTSVEDVREIRERVKFMPVSGKYKIYIIDEVHMLSTNAFNALLKTLEEPPAHVVFVFATTESQKIPATILSRCQRFDLRRLPQANVMSELQAIAKNEGFTLDPVAAALIARESEGSMRDAESLLDQAVAFGGNAVDVQTMTSILGLCDRAAIMRMVTAVLDHDAATLLTHAEDLFVAGVHLQRFVQEMISVLRHMWVLQACGKAVAMEDLLPDEVITITALAARSTPEELHQYIRILSDGVERLARSRTPRLTLETLLLQTTLVRPVIAVDQLLARLEKMESGEPVVRAVPTVRHPRPGSESGAGSGGDPAPVASSPANSTNSSWAGFMTRLQQDKPQLASIVQHSVRQTVSDSIVSLVFPRGSIYADMIKEADRQAQLHGLLGQYFARPLRLDVTLDMAAVDDLQQTKTKQREEKKEQARVATTEALQHTAVKDAMAILQAEIQEVKTFKES